MKTHALWHLTENRSALREEALPGERGKLLIKTRYTLISLGTERLVATGRVPSSMYESMRVPYQEGSLALPVKYGYSLVGEVREGPEDWKGRFVHLLHPHQDYCRVKKEEVTLLPDALDPAVATLASNMETALNAVWDAGLSAGDRVLVVGFGLIGALTALLAKAFPATQVLIAEPNTYRRGLAEEWGFPLWTDEAPPADIAFHCSRSSAGLQSAIDVVGREGRIIELSWYGEDEVKLKLGGDFHHLRKQIISSQVSSIPGKRNARWDYQRRKAAVLRLLLEQDWSPLLDQRILFSETPAFFQRLRRGKVERMSGLVVY